MELPIPLKYLDVMRLTETDISEKEESHINDLWPDAKRELSFEWTGSASFFILRPTPPKGMKWVAGRLTEKPFVRGYSSLFHLLNTNMFCSCLNITHFCTDLNDTGGIK